ncbi:hypothetical protein DXG03_003760 [Asterophora parasitica]|uniref:Short-chain dehydrogenase n=1 Tax=Asterophora parasitica TaxID=117018 RepID=A0A9P7G3C1_9AGAR|nr:hypothetical protein DXG03_003760 [Asterophora parasitica]
MSFQPQALYNLSGRVAVVTGGGTGIGLLIAQGLAASGAKVYITGRRLEVLQKVAEVWNLQNPGGASIVPLQVDVTNKESIAQGKKFIEEKEGKIHILVNNAGQVGPRSPFLSDPAAPQLKDAETLGQSLFDNETFGQWGDLYAINTFSLFFVTTAFLGLLDKGSKDTPGYTSVVINVTSISGLIKLSQDHASVVQFAYNSAKAAASHLTRLLATEFALKKVDVRVNAIAPGVYASEMTHDFIKPEQVDKIGQGLQPVPAARAGTGQEMAGTAVYLASLSGGYMNGQEIIIDGGYTSVNPSTV